MSMSDGFRRRDNEFRGWPVGPAVKKIMVGDEVECDRARITADAVHVRINGVWTELRPEKWIER